MGACNPRKGGLSLPAPQMVWVALTVALAGACTGGKEDSSLAGPWDHLLTTGSGEFYQVSSYDTTGGNRDRFEIAPGDSAVLLDLDGAGVIRRLWITVASRDPDYLRRIALKMYWDGEEAPSISVPLGDFFGNGFEKTHYTALPMGVSSGGFYSYLPMPFTRGARIVAENGTDQVVDAFYFNASVERGGGLPDLVATLHARWNRNPRTTSPEAHSVLEVRGAGHLVGVSLNAEGYDDSYWYLEGDESFWVDGTFRGQGTGTEDYFNGGWYFQDGPFAGPYHGVVFMDPSRGRVAAYRWHLPDPVRFRDSLRVELEHGHGNDVVADLSTVAFWYQTEPHEPWPALPPAGERRILGVKIPPGASLADSLEAERGAGGELRVHLPVPRPDLYDVWAYFEGADGRPEPPVPLDRSVSVPGSGLELELAQGAASPMALHAIPVPRWATDWMAVGPFPNPQRVGSEYSPALDSIFPPEEDPDPARSYSRFGTEGPPMELRWHRITGDSSGYVRLNPHFEPNDWVAAYVQSYLFSPTPQSAVLLLGADDAHQLWVNGELVSTRQGRNISVPDELEVPVSLVAGWNRVVMKVADLDGGWAFHLRAADPSGRMRWSTTTRAP